MMEKGEELECSRRAGGSGIREADSDDRGFPPRKTVIISLGSRWIMLKFIIL